MGFHTEEGLMAVKILMSGGIRINRLQLLAWAHPECKPLTPVKVSNYSQHTPKALYLASDGERLASTTLEAFGESGATISGTVGDPFGGDSCVVPFRISKSYRLLKQVQYPLNLASFH